MALPAPDSAAASPPVPVPASSSSSSSSSSLDIEGYVPPKPLIPGGSSLHRARNSWCFKGQGAPSGAYAGAPPRMGMRWWGAPSAQVRRIAKAEESLASPDDFRSFYNDWEMTASGAPDEHGTLPVVIMFKVAAGVKLPSIEVTSPEWIELNFAHGLEWRVFMHGSYMVGPVVVSSDTISLIINDNPTTQTALRRVATSVAALTLNVFPSPAVPTIVDPDCDGDAVPGDTDAEGKPMLSTYNPFKVIGDAIRVLTFVSHERPALFIMRRMREMPTPLTCALVPASWVRSRRAEWGDFVDVVFNRAVFAAACYEAFYSAAETGVIVLNPSIANVVDCPSMSQELLDKLLAFIGPAAVQKYPELRRKTLPTPPTPTRFRESDPEPAPEVVAPPPPPRAPPAPMAPLSPASPLRPAPSAAAARQPARARVVESTESDSTSDSDSTEPSDSDSDSDSDESWEQSRRSGLASRAKQERSEAAAAQQRIARRFTRGEDTVDGSKRKRPAPQTSSSSSSSSSAAEPRAKNARRMVFM